MIFGRKMISCIAGMLLFAPVTGCQQTKSATGKSSGTAVAPKPTPKPTGPSEFYTAWSSAKVGTEADYQLSVYQNGQRLQLPLYYKLVESTPVKVVLELNFPANRRVTIPAKLDTTKDDGIDDEVKPELVGASGWPALLYQLAYPRTVKTISGHESVVIDGKTYNCSFGTATLLGFNIKQWFAAEVPGGLIKSVVTGGQLGEGKMELTLSSITTK